MSFPFSTRAPAIVGFVIAALLGAERTALGADELIDDPELAARTGEKPRRKPARPAAKRKPPKPTQVTLEEEVELEETPDKESAGGQPGTTVGAADGEQVIADPELAGATPENDGSFGDLSGPREPRWGISFHTRWGYATQQGRPSQDVVEGTTIGIFEVEQRRSDELLYSVGVRFRHAVAVPRDGGTPGYDLDLAPVSAYADLTPTPGFHVRAGYQVIHMGRFDSFTQTNFLAVADLRSGPLTMPGAANIAQPALRFDVDAIEGLTIQAYYVPFFQPHLYPVYGSNYAAIDRFSTLSDDPSVRALREQLDDVFIRSKLSRATTNFAQAFAPAPDFLRPQGAMRITHSGSAGEIAVTAGTALDRLPSSFELVSRGEDSQGNALFPEIRVNHDRFWVFSMDGALDAGPFQLGAEAAYVRDRTLSAIGLLNPRDDVENEQMAPVVTGKSDMFHGGLRAELVEVKGWSGAVEAFVLVALRRPGSPPIVDTDVVGGMAVAVPRTWAVLPQWFGMENGIIQRGLSAGVQYTPEDTGLRLELGGVVFTGPSFIIAPRVEWEALTRVYLEVGGFFLDGPRSTRLGSANVSFAGIYDDIDQVYAGIRWVP